MAKRRVIPVPRRVAELQGTLKWTRETLERLADTVRDLGAVPPAVLVDVTNNLDQAKKNADQLEDRVSLALEMVTSGHAARVAELENDE